ncbi:2-hydroxyacid dehydrogenase [Nonomuraea sp. NPDC000554]|uniref:2-hydroxyacid dehydrogenase n=1 Tax=Nonomuraea sp. NPDC000554 TaxID=3154259 RepID=UPI003326448E
MTDRPEDRTILALVPEERGMAVLSALDGVRPLLYNLTAPLPDEAADAEVMVVPSGPVDEILAIIAGLRSLRLVQTLSAGTDQWEGRLPGGVCLSNVRGVFGPPVAEWTVATLLAVYRDLPSFAAAQRLATWQEHDTDTLDGKRVLVLGAGDLARNLKARLTPFGVDTTLIARHAREDVRAMSDLRTLLPDQDVVVIMLPLTETTHHLVNERFLAQMRDGAILVNAARGPIVDTDALVAEARSGRLRAILDVTDPEPLPCNHPLWHIPGVLITPHVAGDVHNADDRAWRTAAAQIAQYANGNQPANLVT